MVLTLQKYTQLVLVTNCLLSITTAINNTTNAVVLPTMTLSSSVPSGNNSRKMNATVSGSSNSFDVTTTNAEQSTTNTTTAKSGKENDPKAIVIALAVLAFVAVIAAAFFFCLYLRTSRSCYDRLRRAGSSSPETFQFESVNSQSTILPIRARLSSLSTIRRQAICKSEPLSVMAFRDHVKRLHADSDYFFSLEYEAVGGKKYLNDMDKKLDLTSHEGKKSNNKSKNRYSDILPYDHSQVVLSEIEGEPDSVYINASYVDSYRKPQAYIAAQGPLSASLLDFWRMIWESNTRVVVMVTNLLERMKSKCVQYWPDKGSVDYGFLRVSMVKEEMFANYVIRTLSVELLPNQTHYIKTRSESESRVIQQFHFTEWPDHDVPVHPVALLRFIRHSKSASPPDAGPLIVHCSAGVGRSGVYIVIDSMKERIEDDESVDIFNFLNHIRTQRMYLVQEESQYVFVHDCILEHINFGDTNIPIREFHKRLESLRKVNTDTKKSRIRVEFEDIDQTKNPEKHKWAGKKHYNVAKNRRKDVLPVERTRVKLPLVLGIEGADYINASFIDGFSKKREYIATQAPMIKTGECFYRMIFSTKCCIIVMLLDDEQWRKDDYADLPTENEAVTCGRFEIHLESQDVTEKVIIRKLRLFSSENSDGHTVTHFHYRDWPASGLPKDKTSLLNFIEQVKEYQMAESPDNPIVVHCDHGVGATGVFCLVSSLSDQIDRERYIDVFHAAKLLRVQRPKLIETEDQYSFCYEVLDQLIARKLISMSPDSDSDEPESSGILDNKNATHTRGMNGSVTGAKSLKADANSLSSPSVDKSPEQTARNSSLGNESPNVGSPHAGIESPINESSRENLSPNQFDKDSGKLSQRQNQTGQDPNEFDQISSRPDKSNTGSESNIVTKDNVDADSSDSDKLDSELPNTSSSRQALLSSSESSS